MTFLRKLLIQIFSFKRNVNNVEDQLRYMQHRIPYTSDDKLKG